MFVVFDLGERSNVQFFFMFIYNFSWEVAPSFRKPAGSSGHCPVTHILAPCCPTGMIDLLIQQTRASSSLHTASYLQLVFTVLCVNVNNKNIMFNFSPHLHKPSAFGSTHLRVLNEYLTAPYHHIVYTYRASQSSGDAGYTTRRVDWSGNWDFFPEEIPELGGGWWRVCPFMKANKGWNKCSNTHAPPTYCGNGIEGTPPTAISSNQGELSWTGLGMGALTGFP